MAMVVGAAIVVGAGGEAIGVITLPITEAMRASEAIAFRITQV